MRILLSLLTTVWITVAHAASPNMELAKSVFDPRIMSNAVESPVPGLYQFAQGNEVFYISADGRYVMQGEMIDLQTQINVTETFRASERVKTLAALDPKTMISVLPNAPAYHITVFTDVDCPYCRLMQQNILEYTQRGIAIHYLAYPRSGPNSSAALRMAQVWCTSDSRGDCSKIIREQYAIAQKLGISSTPSIILEDGTLIPGFVAPANLETILNKHPEQIEDEKSDSEETALPEPPPHPLSPPPPPPTVQ